MQGPSGWITGIALLAGHHSRRAIGLGDWQFPSTNLRFVIANYKLVESTSLLLSPRGTTASDVSQSLVPAGDQRFPPNKSQLQKGGDMSRTAEPIPSRAVRSPHCDLWEPQSARLMQGPSRRASQSAGWRVGNYSLPICVLLLPITNYKLQIGNF